MRSSLRLTGLVAAPHTPFSAEGELHLSVVAKQAQLLRDGGVHGVFIAGTTGECASLTVDERKALTDAWLDQVGKEMPVIVHVGSNSLPDAREIAKHAQAAGADAIATLPPNYFKPRTQDDLVHFCARVADAAPQLPIYYYDIPHMSGVALTTADFLVAARKSIPTLHGVKFSNNDFISLQECLSLDGLDIVFGFDELLLCAVALGVQGAVGATYNFAAPLYHRIFKGVASGNLADARVAQRQSVALIRLLNRFGFSRASKAMMKLQGVDCGPPRSPIAPLIGSELSLFVQELQAFDGLTRPIWV